MSDDSPPAGVASKLVDVCPVIDDRDRDQLTCNPGRKWRGFCRPDYVLREKEEGLGLAYNGCMKSVWLLATESY